MTKRRSSEHPRLRFLGAAGTVTGSRFLLERDGRQVLVDCGLYQGLKELRLRNWRPWPGDLSKLDACVITHAHIDHSGYLPRLFRLGYSGPVYCTEGTAALLEILLPDAAYLQVADAEYANRKGYSKHKPAEPLYDERDAAKVLSRLETVGYDDAIEIPGGMDLAMFPAGHLLGSASVLLSWGRAGARRRLLISGDLGKYDDYYMRPPQPPEEHVDYLLIESTYGDRLHASMDVREELARIVNDSVDRGGVLLIPSFAVGRAQELLFYLGDLERSGAIPELPVYVDSPMAIDATDVYRSFAGEMNFEWRPDVSPLLTARTVFTRSVDDSKALANVRSRAVIISASGMATGGRVVHHLAQRVGDSENTIMFAGFQVDGTRGRKLVDGASTIRMFGRDWPVKAAVENFAGFSAHGDRDDLLRWARSLNGRPRRTFVVHGEPRAAEALADGLAEELGYDAIVAGLAASVRLD